MAVPNLVSRFSRGYAPSSVRALRHRSFRRWMLAGLVSVSGTWMQQVAQSWLVLDRTHSGTAVGITIALQAGPALTLGLWGGTLADRVDRRRLLLVTQTLSALLALGLGAAVAHGHGSVRVIQLFALASGLVGVVDGPAGGALSSSLLPPDDLANGLALGSVVASSGRVLGLALAGVAVAAVGPAVAFGLNGVSFFAPVVVLAGLPASPPPGTARGEAPRALRAELREGVHHVWRNAEARSTIATAWVLSCFGRNFQVTMALMAAEAFGAGAGLYGRFSSLFALGAMGGSLLATRLDPMRRRVLAGAAATAAVFQVASGLAPSSLLFGVLLVPIAAGAVVLDTSTSTRVQLSTDPAMRGRVLSIAGLCSMTAGMVGAPLLGWLGQHLGPRTPLVLGGAIAVAATLRYASVRRGRPDPVRALVPLAAVA